MSLYGHSRTLPGRFRLVLASFLQRPGLPFADALPEETIQKVFEEEAEASFAKDEDDVYTPAITLWAFLSQVLFKDEQRSCIAAVARVMVFLVELDIRAIKITMGMDVLRCKTPEMVRKEMWTCLLAYNLVRQTMLQSARESGLRPRELSFTAALQSIAASWLVIVLSDDSVAATLIEVSLASLTLHTIGHRPNRVEPCAVKRRPKPHDLLTTPRAEARNELLTGERKKSS